MKTVQSLGDSHVARVALALLILATFAVALNTGPAAQPAHAANVCTPHAFTPTDNDTTAWGWTNLDCTNDSPNPGYVEATLQRHRAWGWQNIDNDEVWASTMVDTLWNRIEYNCNGTGTFTYRTIHDRSWDFSHNNYGTVISNTYRSAC